MMKNPPRRSDGLTRHSSRNYTCLYMLYNDVSAVNPDLPRVICFLALARTRKNPAAVALGRIRTAKKTAAARINVRNAIAARLAKQTPEQRSAQAKLAAAARWGKKR